MAQYFNYFPQTKYNFGTNDPNRIVTNVTSRFSFEETLKDNTTTFYKYYVKDGETPEILAHKFYGSSEKHWIILMMNNIVDPFYDWPMDERRLNEYIIDKYSANVTSERNGLEWAKTNVKSFYKVITTNYQNTSKEELIEVDHDTYYYNTVNTSKVIQLADGNNITEAITKRTKTYYDFEVEENENRRQIKILKYEFISSAHSQLQSIFNA